MQSETPAVSEDSEPDSDSTCTCALKTYRNEHLGDFSFDYLDTDWTLTETTIPKSAEQEYLPDDILITLASEHDDGKIEVTLLSSDVADGGGPGTCIKAIRGIDYNVFGNDTYYRSSFAGWIREQDGSYSYADHIVPVEKIVKTYKNDPDSRILSLYINEDTATEYSSVDELPKPGYCLSYDSTDFRIISSISVDPNKTVYGTDKAVFTVRIQYTGPDIKSAEKVFKTIGGLQ